MPVTRAITYLKMWLDWSQIYQISEVLSGPSVGLTKSKLYKIWSYIVYGSRAQPQDGSFTDLHVHVQESSFLSFTL